jgi:hypothetical protein
LATFEHVAETDSTMERAREIALDTALALPAAVVADRQSLGRGRRGARWWQPPGSLTTSIVLDGAVAGLAPRQAEPRPNILLVISDDQSWRDAGAYGAKHVATPAATSAKKSSVSTMSSFTRAENPRLMRSPTTALLASMKDRS